MKQLKLNHTYQKENIKILAQSLNGTVDEDWGITVISFDNTLGKGKIRCIELDRGICIYSYQVQLKNDFLISTSVKLNPWVNFVFLLEGELSFMKNSDVKKINKYQNIIVGNPAAATNSFFFPSGKKIQVNFINLIIKKNKKPLMLSQVSKGLSSFLLERKIIYQHFGNFNLKIADHIKSLYTYIENEPKVRFFIEGYTHLIIAFHLADNYRYENGLVLPASITSNDVEKIYFLSRYIVENTSDTLTISSLTKVSGLSPKKLQLGFKLLYSQTVNEHIRHIKLEIARDHIINSGLSISEIVYQIGFKSRSYFSKIFTTKYGVLPTEYRKKIKAKVLPISATGTRS